MSEREVKGWAVVSPRGKFIATGTTEANAWLQAEVAAGYVYWGYMKLRGYRIVPARVILEVEDD